MFWESSGGLSAETGDGFLRITSARGRRGVFKVLGGEGEQVVVGEPVAVGLGEAGRPLISYSEWK